MAPHIIAQYGQFGQTGYQPSPTVTIVYLLCVVLMIAAWWRVFTKAGQPGWAAIVPILNLYILCKVARMSGWWVLACFIPLVNLIAFIIISVNVAKRFGKGVLFGIGLLLLPFIFYPILAWGDAQAA